MNLALFVDFYLLFPVCETTSCVPALTGVFVTTVALERQLQAAVRHDTETARDGGDFKKVWTLSRLFPLVNLPHEGVMHYCHAVRLALRDELTRRSLTLDTQPKGMHALFSDIVFSSSTTPSPHPRLACLLF